MINNFQLKFSSIKHAYINLILSSFNIFNMKSISIFSEIILLIEINLLIKSKNFLFLSNSELKKILDQFTYARQSISKCGVEDNSDVNSQDWMNISPYEQSVVTGQALKLRKDFSQNFTVNFIDTSDHKTIKRRKRRIMKKRNSFNHFSSPLNNDDNFRNELVDTLEELWPTTIFDILNLGKFDIISIVFHLLIFIFSYF